MATALYTAILSTSYSSILPTEISAMAQRLNIPASTIPSLLKAALANTAVAYSSVPGITPAITAQTQLTVKVSYTEAYRVVYLSALAFGILGIVFALLTKTTPRSLKTTHRAVRLENEKLPLGDEEVKAVAA